MIVIALAVVALLLVVADIRRRRRQIEELAELAGVERFAGESDESLLERCGSRFRILEGGRRG